MFCDPRGRNITDCTTALKNGSTSAACWSRHLQIECDCEWSTHRNPRGAAKHFAFRIVDLKKEFASLEILELCSCEFHRFDADARRPLARADHRGEILSQGITVRYLLCVDLDHGRVRTIEDVNSPSCFQSAGTRKINSLPEFICRTKFVCGSA